jgi:hypothetical protein
VAAGSEGGQPGGAAWGGRPGAIKCCSPELVGGRGWGGVRCAVAAGPGAVTSAAGALRSAGGLGAGGAALVEAQPQPRRGGDVLEQAACQVGVWAVAQGMCRLPSCSVGSRCAWRTDAHVAPPRCAAAGRRGRGGWPSATGQGGRGCWSSVGLGRRACAVGAAGTRETGAAAGQLGCQRACSGAWARPQRYGPQPGEGMSGLLDNPRVHHAPRTRYMAGPRARLKPDTLVAPPPRPAPPRTLGPARARHRPTRPAGRPPARAAAGCPTLILLPPIVQLAACGAAASGVQLDGGRWACGGRIMQRGAL